MLRFISDLFVSKITIIEFYSKGIQIYYLSLFREYNNSESFDKINLNEFYLVFGFWNLFFIRKFFRFPQCRIIDK